MTSWSCAELTGSHRARRRVTLLIRPTLLLLRRTAALPCFIMNVYVQFYTVAVAYFSARRTVTNSVLLDDEARARSAGGPGDDTDPASSRRALAATAAVVAAAPRSVARHPPRRSLVVRRRRRRVRLQRQSTQSARVQLPADGWGRRAGQWLRGAGH